MSPAKRFLISQFSCQNEQCRDYGKKGLGNIWLHHWTKKDQIRNLKCRTCGRDFSERKGSARYRGRLDENKVKAIHEGLMNRKGIREISESVGVRPKTVSRYRTLFGFPQPKRGRRRNYPE